MCEAQSYAEESAHLGMDPDLLMENFIGKDLEGTSQKDSAFSQTAASLKSANETRDQERAREHEAQEQHEAALLRRRGRAAKATS